MTCASPARFWLANVGVDWGGLNLAVLTGMAIIASRQGIGATEKICKEKIESLKK